MPRLWRRGLRRCAGTTLARVRARALGVRRRRGNCLVSRSPRWPADWVGLSPIGPLPLERRLDNQAARLALLARLLLARRRRKRLSGRSFMMKRLGCAVRGGFRRRTDWRGDGFHRRADWRSGGGASWFGDCRTDVALQALRPKAVAPRLRQLSSAESEHALHELEVADRREAAGFFRCPHTANWRRWRSARGRVSHRHTKSRLNFSFLRHIVEKSPGEAVALGCGVSLRGTIF